MHEVIDEVFNKIEENEINIKNIGEEELKIIIEEIKNNRRKAKT